MKTDSPLYQFLSTKGIEFHYYKQGEEKHAIPIDETPWQWFDEYVLFLAKYGK